MRIFLTGATGATGVIGRRALPLLIGAGQRRDRCRAPATIARRACPRRCDPDRGRSVRRRRRPQNGGRARRRRQSRHPYARGLSRFPAGRLGRERPHPPLRVGKSGGRGDGDRRRGSSRSFAPVYPDRGDQWIDERTPIAPVRYNRTVADAERSADALLRQRAPAWCCGSRCSMAPILVHPRPDRLRPARLGADPGRRRRLYLFGLARGRRRRGRRGAGCSARHLQRGR